jgi:serine/threonine protein kinase/tetratricopeptide (TPR) repeat protein
VTDDRWQLAYTIYEAAFSLTEPERQQYVNASAPDAEIAGKVFAMLSEMENADGSSLFPEQAYPTGSASRHSLTTGSRLGPYEILDRIGAGGMGVVYRARDPRLNRQVAIKLLSPEMAADPQARERLRREARAAAALDHPYICKVFEIGEAGDALYLVMEYVGGETLHNRLLNGRMSLSETLHVAGEIAEALQEAHAGRLLHRDLKPANIMLTLQGHVKVMDFGLAKRIPDQPSSHNSTVSSEATRAQLTAPGTLLGTPDYMSPEQVKGLSLDPRSDLFSFGVILAEMISGRHPFRKPSMMETLSAVLRDSPDFGAGLHQGTTVQGLIVMTRRMLAKEVAERYPSIADMRADMARLAASSETAAATIAVDKHQSDRIPPIGRDTELKQLTRQLEDALAGRGSLILIGGEPGIGKSYLTSALLEAARLRGAFALTGHCYEMEGSPPYVPFIEMLEHTFRSMPRDAFRYALGDDAPEVARLMPELRQMFPGIPAAMELPPEQQRRFLFNAYRQFVERSARLTPVAALFEDLQWADEPTLLLLQHLAQAVAGIPLLIVGTYRDVDLEVGRPCAAMLENLLRQKLGTRILLRRLPVSGVEEMLASLSARQPPPSLTRVIFEETEGNPFFVEEMFRHLAEEGKLFDETGAFRPGLRGDELQVPEGVRLVLGRRLARLSEDARRILTTAAVIGRVFPLELLENLEAAKAADARPEAGKELANASRGAPDTAAVLRGFPENPKAADAALEAIEEAERARLVEMDTPGRQIRYRFVHELLRQTLSEKLSLPRRQRLHARVAGAMERVYSTTIDAHVSALAHHLYQAGSFADQEKTIHFLSEAARRASAAAAHEEALDHLDKAISLLDNEFTACAAGLRARRAGVLLSLSRTQEAVQEYERALELFDSLGNDVRFVETCSRLAILYTWATRFHDVKAVIDRAAQHAKNAPAPTRCIVLAMQAHSASIAGEIDRSLDLLEELHQIPENQLPAAVIGFAADQEMFTRHGAGQLNLCEAAARKAILVYQQSGDVWSPASVEMGLFWPPLLSGRPAEAERLILEAIPRAMRIGFDLAKSLALWVLADVHIAKGDLEKAERAAREALALMESLRFGWRFVVEISLGGILLYRDRTEEAISVLTNAAAGPAELCRGFPEGLLALGMTAAEMPGAANACTAAMRFLPRQGTSRGIGAWNAVLSLTEALCLCGRREEAARLEAEAEKIAAEWDCSHAGFPVRTAAGIAAACAGNWTRAEEHHRAAISRMEAVPYITAQPVARYWYAGMLAARGGPGDIETAKTMLETCIATSDEIGLALYARLARQKLTRIAQAG